MAVIVQRLAGGEAAGVCMSCDPVTGATDTVVVNAAFGLGELVVSGLVTPDDYRLSRADGALVGFSAGYKDIMLVMGADGPVERPVPAERREARVLDDALLALCTAACSTASASSAAPPTASSASSTAASSGCSADP